MNNLMQNRNLIKNDKTHTTAYINVVSKIEKSDAIFASINNIKKTNYELCS